MQRTQVASFLKAVVREMHWWVKKDECRYPSNDAQAVVNFLVYVYPFLPVFFFLVTAAEWSRDEPGIFTAHDSRSAASLTLSPTHTCTGGGGGGGVFGQLFYFL
jgi:hypothetical protein